MQFPVPQFTEVEDRIIGPLTVKQFGIIFGAGVIVFLGYSSTKSVLVTVFLFILFGLPALGVAFAKINGRPVYSSFSYFLKFWTAPKALVFHKEGQGKANLGQVKDAEVVSTAVAEVAPQTPADTRSHLRQVQELLRQTEQQEREALKEEQS